MKPNGVVIGVGESGVRIGVRRITRTEDKVWEAVEMAVDEGWSVRQFIAEARAAWGERLQRDARAVDEEFQRRER